MKILVKLHRCQELFEYFLVCFEKDDVKLAAWTDSFFREHATQYADFVQKEYLPRLLNVVEMDCPIIERAESVMSGLMLLRI